MKIEVELNPFIVPEKVIQKTKPFAEGRGYSSLPTYLLSDLEEETLSALCDEFRKGVFAQAGKIDPNL